LNSGCLVALILAGSGGLLVLLVGSAIFFPAFSEVTKRARVVQTHHLLRQTELAVMSYVAEYVKPPETTGSGPVALEGAILETLLGTASPANPRGIAFLALPPARDGRGGLAAGPPPFLADAWGTPVRILLDTSGTGSLPDPEHPGTSVAESALLWSAGPDRDFDTWADNVKSWGP
jgi:hypothetical protein